MKPSLLEIFKIYFIIGLQLFGGGYVIYPLLKKYLVQDKNYITEEELTDYLSLSQCLPGIIALNISIFSGYKLRKFLGAIIAPLALILPSFLIIIGVAKFLLQIASNPIVKNAFYGIRLSIIVLIFFMIYDVYKKTKITNFTIGLFFVILFASLYAKVSPAILVSFAIIVIFLKGGTKNDND